MDSEFLTQILYILAGAIISQIFPLLNFIFIKCKHRYELSKIKKMIYHEYVNPLEEMLDDISTETDHIFREELHNSVERIEYLKENEIKYLNSEIQFEIIRMIEYTKSYLKILEDIITQYEYPSLKAVPPGQSNKEYSEKIRKGKSLTTHYKNTIDRYIKLHRNSLITGKNFD